jgi:hypothetical protein
MGLKQGAIGNTIGEHIGNLGNMLGTQEKHCKKLVETGQLLASGQLPLKSMSIKLFSIL